MLATHLLIVIILIQVFDLILSSVLKDPKFILKYFKFTHHILPKD